MSLKIMGAIFIILACGGCGFMMAASYRKEERTLRQLISALEYMQWELSYKITPLPELCAETAKHCKDVLSKVFLNFTDELENQISPDAGQCMRAALDRTKELPSVTREMLLLLGTLVGRFDLDGQLKGLESVRMECIRIIEELENNKEVRLRNYQTLGLCAGAAIVILLM